MAPRVFWIGLGNMGRPMCKNLVEKGPLDAPLLLYNRTLALAHDVAQDLGGPAKAEVAESVAAGAARADIIFLSLTNDAVVSATVRDLLAAEGGLRGKLVVDTTTVSPETADATAASVAGGGGEFVSAPVFGAPAAAVSAQLVTALAGTSAEAVARARPYMGGVICRDEAHDGVIDMSGQAPGRALALKLVGNSFIFNMVEQLAEAHVVAEKSGLGTGVLHQLVRAYWGGPYLAYSTRMLEGDYHARERPLFGVELARKDTRLIMVLAASAGARMPNVETADAHLAKLEAAVGDRGDLAGIYGVVRMEAGLDYKVKKE